MSARLSAKMTKLFLFNSSWEKREGEEVKKLIYYYNFNHDNQASSLDNSDFEFTSLFNCSKSELQEAVNIMGLSQALISFVTNFGQNEGK